MHGVEGVQLKSTSQSSVRTVNGVLIGQSDTKYERLRIASNASPWLF